MAILPIRVVPDPILRRKARPVVNIDAAIRKLAADMIDTMQAAPGAGLAAPQVGILKRVVTLQMPEEEPFALVNPEITRREGKRRVEEGCLSVPGYVGLITRSLRIMARAVDLKGGAMRITAEELLAQAIEHEVDHLNGILFLDHLEKHEDLRRVEETSGAHAHDDIDFAREAAHGNVIPVEDRRPRVAEAGNASLLSPRASGRSEGNHGATPQERIANLEQLLGEARERIGRE